MDRGTLPVKNNVAGDKASITLWVIYYNIYALGGFKCSKWH